MNQKHFFQLWQQMQTKQIFPNGLLITGSAHVIHCADPMWVAMICREPKAAADGNHPCESCDACHKHHLQRSPYHWLLEPGEHRSVPLDEIRAMQREIALQRASTMGNVPYLVIIPDAARVSMAGWNVMLKVLEEPPERVLFLVFGVQAKAVPPTVRSRMTAYYVHHETSAEAGVTRVSKSMAKVLNEASLQQFLQQEKPQAVEDWSRWVQQLHQAMAHACELQQSEAASLLAGAFLEVSDCLSRKRLDGSLNLKYEISRIIAAYEAESHGMDRPYR